MRTTRLATVTMAAILTATAASANHVGPSASVDCSGTMAGAFTSISAALATLSLDGPHLVFVRGTCQETVDIVSRGGLTLAAPDGAVVKEHSGYGIEASLGSSVNFQTFDAADGSRQGPVIEENGSVGINLAGSASANAGEYCV